MGRGGPVGGGPTFLREEAGRLHHLAPSTTLASWADTNSVLSAVTVAGHLVTLTMANPAAGRDLPTTGASYVFDLQNLLGASITSLDNAALRWLLTSFSAGTDVPADCWVGLVLINASTVDAATLGVGMVNQGNGTGIRNSFATYAAGWSVSGAATHSANTRYCTLQTRASGSNTTQTVSLGAHCHDSTGGHLNAASAGSSSTFTAAPVTHVALCAGWVAGTGAAGAQIKVRPYLFASNLHRLPGIL